MKFEETSKNFMDRLMISMPVIMLLIGLFFFVIFYFFNESWKRRHRFLCVIGFHRYTKWKKHEYAKSSSDYYIYEHWEERHCTRKYCSKKQHRDTP